jgi:uncharacterized protein DUF222
MIECMFDGSLPEIGDLAGLEDAALVAAAAGWVRAENAACARKLAVLAELFCRRTGLPADERESWWVDPCAAVGAELGAALGISSGLALTQTQRAVALRDRLPKVAALFAAGLISDLLVRAIVWRTHLITDPDVMAAVDAELAEHVSAWGALSVKKTEHSIDALVDRHDPAAICRSRAAVRARMVEFGSPDDEAGFTSLWARLYATDGAALERRLDTMARSVCPDDPRTMAERRADAIGALAAGLELSCGCTGDDCARGDRDRPPPTAVVHIVAEAATVTAARTSAQESAAPPAYVLGGGVLPAALLSTVLDRATVREIRHPGDAAPEPGYRPSAALAEFVRCRDLTCRFPHCDVPADRCDVDHTVPYPFGPTHASNLKCQCRSHHLLKTFWRGEGGWSDRQSPDGTVIWTAPTGHTYTTRPGSALLFPTLSAPTGSLALPAPDEIVATGARAMMMPKRRRTRDRDLAYRIAAERRLNDPHVAERNQPPPFSAKDAPPGP